MTTDTAQGDEACYVLPDSQATITEGTLRERTMADKNYDSREQDPQIEDLNEEIAEQQADSVKGGAARRSGDDDLEDLEVERRK